MGGHSQGGGHAGVMTKMFSMSRACYFASPPDWNTGSDSPATWESYANVTPASKQFGIGGKLDTSVPYDQLSRIWTTMGLTTFGPPIDVDSSAEIAGSSHTLTTSLTPETSSFDLGNPNHGVTVRDAFTPLTSSGAPVFEKTWKYLCFE